MTFAKLAEATTNKVDESLNDVGEFPVPRYLSLTV